MQPGRGKRPALPGDERASGFRAAVDLDNIDPEEMPKRHGGRRHRGAAAEDKFKPVEAEAAQYRREHANPAQTMENVDKASNGEMPTSCGAPPRYRPVRDEILYSDSMRRPYGTAKIGF